MSSKKGLILVVSVWTRRRGGLFIDPDIEASMALARKLNCVTGHHKDCDFPGQFNACHAERLVLVHWIKHLRSEGENLFAVLTSRHLCEDCRKFLGRAGDYYKIRVYTNGELL